MCQVCINYEPKIILVVVVFFCSDPNGTTGYGSDSQEDLFQDQPSSLPGPQWLGSSNETSPQVYLSETVIPDQPLDLSKDETTV